MSRRHSNKSHSTNKTSKTPKNSRPAVSQVRIIGGRFKRQLIPFMAVDGLRPTPDRLRETLFNWVQFDLNDARVLDVCAGSGVLGLEALSRGARHTTFIELVPKQATLLQQTCEKLKLTPASVDIYVGDALKVVPQLGLKHHTGLETNPALMPASPSAITAVGATAHLDNISSATDDANGNSVTDTKSIQALKYHLIFVDPPYDLELWVPIIEALLSHELVTTDSLFYVEDRRPLTETLKDLSTLYSYTTVKETKIGQIYANLIKIHTL